LTMDSEHLCDCIGPADLAAAIEDGDLVLFFQPKIDVISGAMKGVEALLRWQHEDLGWIPPSNFVPIAEEFALIDRLTGWVLDAAIAQWSAWADKGDLRTNIAVNISPKNLESVDFPDLVDATCVRHGVSAEYFTIELTESAAQSAVKLMDTMTRFRIKGMSISLDDFGIGYSSLAQLQQLPFSEMKVDRSFVMQAEASNDSRIIVKSIVDLAHNLGLEVTAEGVESAAVMKLLTDYGCDKAQGYYIARPMPADALLDWARSSANCA